MFRRLRLVSTFLRLALSALVLLSAISFAPGSAAAAGTKSFTSDLYGFTVSWDSSAWTSNSGDPDSLTLSSDASAVAVTGFGDATSDLNGCVSRLATKRKHAKDVSDFKQVTTGYTMPNASEGSVSALYGLTDASGGDSIAKLLYIECRPGNTDQLTRISFETNNDAYDAEVRLFNKVHQTISLGDAATTDSGNGTTSGGDVASAGPSGRIGGGIKPSTPDEPVATATKTSSTKTTKSDPVLKGNVYTGANKAYTITFDDAVWTAKAITPGDSGNEGLTLNSDKSIATIEVLTTTLSLDKCLSGSIELMGQTESFSDLVAAPDLAGPETVKGVAGSMVTFVVTTENGPVDFTGYVECRTLDKGKTIIRSEIASPNVFVTDAIPTWSNLLGGIKVAKASSGGTAKATATATPKPKKTPTTKKTPKATATAEGGAFPNVNGTTFTSPAFGYTFTWPEKFTPLLASGDDSGDVVAISDGTSTALIFSKSTADGTTTASCLKTKEDALLNSATIKDAAVMTGNDNAEVRGKTSTGSYVLYSYTSDKGVLLYDYLRCDAAQCCVHRHLS